MIIVLFPVLRTIELRASAQDKVGGFHVSRQGLELPLIGFSAWRCNTCFSPSETYPVKSGRVVWPAYCTCKPSSGMVEGIGIILLVLQCLSHSYFTISEESKPSYGSCRSLAIHSWIGT